VFIDGIKTQVFGKSSKMHRQKIVLVNSMNVNLATKGQLISKWPFWCHRLDQDTNKKFARISAPASKKRSKKKKKGHFILLIGGFYFDSLTLLFLFDLFLESRADILKKTCWYFGPNEPKGHFEIN
jgi:hypothetical protein